MDNRAIGVFDSGMGGLTTVRELMKILPGEDIIYFGDTGRVPYGSRSPETILKYARQDVAFLQTFDLKAIAVACGTVSTIALDALAAESSLPLIGVVEPAVDAAIRVTKQGKIGLIGTKATIQSGAYERLLKKKRPDTVVTAQACPLFVPLVESGHFAAGDPLVELVVKEYLELFKEQGVDTLILGCTHYPLLADAIGQYLGPQVALVNSGAACAAKMAALLEERVGKNQKAEGGIHRYFVSDSTSGFSTLASVFLGEDVTGQVEQIAIEHY